MSAGSCMLSKQYGINITSDAVENKIQTGQLTDFSSLEKFFMASGVKLNLIKIKKQELSNKAYVLPAIAAMNNGTSNIVTSIRPSQDGDTTILQYLDPLNPSGKIEDISLDKFLKIEKMNTIFGY